MTVARKVMKTKLFTVKPAAPLPEAIKLLIDHKISGLPVVDGGGRLVGILTEKDVMRLMYEEKGTVTKVSDLMVRDVRTFQADAPLADVCDCLMANNFRRVPILEGEKLVGLISRADLMPEILRAACENTR